MKRNRVIFSLVSIFGSLFLLGLIFWTIDWRQALGALAAFSFSKFSVFFAFTLVTFHLHVFRHRLILGYYRRRVGFYRLFAVRLTGVALSYLIPSASLAGEPMRGHLLRKAGVDYRTGYASVILDKFWELAPNFFLMIYFLFLALFQMRFSFYLYVLILAVSLLYFSVFYLFYSRALRGRGIFTSIFRSLRIGRIFPKLNELEPQITEIEEVVSAFLRNRKKEFYGVILLAPLVYLSGLVEFWLLADLLGLELGFFGAVVIQAFFGLATVFPTAAGIGVQELGGAGSFAMLGFKSALGLTYALLWRVRDLIYAVLGLVCLLFFGGWQGLKK